jgi:predicted acetyltransferase
LRNHFHLVTPSPAWLPAFLDIAREFHAHGEPRYEDALRDPEAYLRHRNQYATGTDLPPDRVPETTFWLVTGEGGFPGPVAPQVLAVSGLRHWLTPQLTDIGGHIGYAVRPGARRQGIGTALLARTLIEARKHGLARVLVTCDVTNIGSARIIQHNGGVLEDERIVPGHQVPVTRYWIALESGSERCDA